MTRATCFPAARTIIICVNGAIRPPLMPWRMRNPINEFADQARPHKAEESVKAEKHQRDSVLALKRAPPASGGGRETAGAPEDTGGGPIEPRCGCGAGPRRDWRA